MKTIIFLLLAIPASAQTTLQQQVENVVLNEQKRLIKCEETERFADYLARFTSHYQLFETAFDSYNSDQFYSVDVFLHDNPQEILQQVRFSEKLNFRLPEVLYVAVVVRKEGDDYLVLITTYDN